ncbi:helix-turn-helix domain-containing protein [Paraburkholderia humisilvae]|uniref:helix-turn-helix domain-containing protein n=1 Tax=Paraburkholderia humisilvae TaxID=627669 RepID=UPI00158423B8
MEIKRTSRFRTCPTPDQDDMQAGTFGCVRFACKPCIGRGAMHGIRVRSVSAATRPLLRLTLKNTVEHARLTEGNLIPLRQGVCHLRIASPIFLPGT